MKEFNLSSTILLGKELHFSKENVKEFIRRDKELIKLMMLKKISVGEFWYRREKLAGENLNDN